MARILVVDDDQDTRVLVSRILGEDLGHEIVFAADGVAALEAYRKFPADVVITDLVMPNLNGFLLIELLLDLDRSSQIIAISGRAVEHLDRARAAGAIIGLEKPLDSERLKKAVARALEVRGPWHWRR